MGGAKSKKYILAVYNYPINTLGSLCVYCVTVSLQISLMSYNYTDL